VALLPQPGRRVLRCVNFLNKIHYFDPSTASRTGTGKRKEQRMGKGDQRTKRGKIFRGTFGKTRPKKVKKNKESASSSK